MGKENAAVKPGKVLRCDPDVLVGAQSGVQPVDLVFTVGQLQYYVTGGSDLRHRLLGQLHPGTASGDRNDLLHCQLGPV